MWRGCRARPHRCSGIDVVRNQIKTFAQQKVVLPEGKHKIIILDEADRCPPAAAAALQLTAAAVSRPLRNRR